MRGNEMLKRALVLIALAGCAQQPIVETSRATGETSCRFTLRPAFVASGSHLPPFLTVTPPSDIYATTYGFTVTEPSYGIYPGSTVYAEINGQRWSGEERIWITPELKAALLSGGTMNVSWSPWPWGDRDEASISLKGYRGECL